MDGSGLRGGARAYADFGTGDVLHACGSMHQQGAAFIDTMGHAVLAIAEHHLTAAQDVAVIEAGCKRGKTLALKCQDSPDQWIPQLQQDLGCFDAR
jgi:hypothetical protein